MSTDIFPVLGDVASGIFTNSEDLWQQMKSAGVHSGDRVWRMPLWEYFSKLMCSSRSTDVQNVGIGRGGGSCKGAAFLREFVPCGPWMHVVSVLFSSSLIKKIIIFPNFRKLAEF